MTRDEIFQVIRAHLADELEVDAGTISEATRFKDDLQADSLDLYTLVQELEDSYGVRMSDEQAAQISTVGQAVDFVLSVTGGKAQVSASETAGENQGAHASTSADAGGSEGAHASTPASAGRDD